MLFNCCRCFGPPSVFDMVATAMCMFGLVDVSVSLYQMLRGGSSIAFTSLMKHFFLPGDGLQLQNWVGVAFCLVSIFLCSAVAGGDPSSPSSPSTPATSNAPLVGVCLILGGGVVQSMQYVFEERIMSDDVGLAPLLVVALEGLWGFAFCCGVLLPLVYALPGSDHGHLEDPLSSLDMIAHSGAIQAFFGVYLLFIFAYNSFSVLVTKELDAVWHSILDLWRPVSVWLLSLAIHYSTELTLPGGASYGEAWVWPGSLVQLFAMGLLLYGTAIYNGSVAVPALVLSFLVASGVVARAEAEAARTPTPSKFASPYRSPLLVRSIRQASEGEHQRESAPDGRGGPELAPVPGVFELPKIPLGTRRFSEI
mmetsp:Transcript_12649/g.21379  ORF Transcript_12649/g.21379 Transcript_12649/m.21379 type:complete len:366 (+) Transcript_12649:419-1516(+)